MTAIYLCGYAAESLIGSAYFRLVGLSANDVINKERLHNYLKAARQFIQVSDTAHPLDGESRFLINQSVLLRRPGYPSLFSREIISRVDSICRHWSHKLRYRAILADETQADEVIRATRWLLDNHSDM